MRKKYICILAAVIGFCSLSGCGSSAKKTEEEQVTIGVVTKSKSSEYWLSVCDGMKDAAEKYHADVVILSPDSETEEEVQKSLILVLTMKSWVMSWVSSLQRRLIIKERSV